MAIQLPNPGLGDGQTGDNEFVMWTKVKDNFNNQTHAASRLVGTNAGNLLEAGALGIAGASNLVSFNNTNPSENPPITKSQFWYSVNFNTSPIGIASSYGIALPYNTGSDYGAYIGFVPSTKRVAIKWHNARVWENVVTEFYTTSNTTKDSNGMIKASSPVLRVFSDRIEGNDDGKKMGAEFVKKGVGNYLIKGTTGLADEGWYVTVPQDANGNNLVAVEYESLENGDVALRTYKRRFDFETVSVVADHDSPLDIPDTRWIDLRFNEIEREVANEPIE